MPWKRGERIKRRSSNTAVRIPAGHTVNSGMTVTVRWGAIADLLRKWGSSFLLLLFKFQSEENKHEKQL